MKRCSFFVFIFLLLYGLTAQALDISRHMSGSWYNQQQDGHGISLEILPDNRAVFYWYVYNTDGTPTFLIALGNLNGNTIIADAYHLTGMPWPQLSPANKVQTLWGEIRLEFQGCNNLTLSYDSEHSLQDIPSGNGSIELSRLAYIDYLQCVENRSAGIYRGYLETEAGAAYGATFLLSPDGELVAFVDDQFAAFGGYNIDSADNGVLDLQNVRVHEFSSPGMAPGAFTAQGSISPEYRIVLEDWDVFPMNGDMGELFAVDKLFRHGLDFSRFAGSAQAEDLITEEEGYADVYPVGNGNDLHIDGSTGSSGCTFNGTLTPWHTTMNMYMVELTLSGCGQRDGSYDGLGYQTDPDSSGDYRALALAADNGSYPFALSVVAW